MDISLRIFLKGLWDIVRIWIVYFVQIIKIFIELCWYFRSILTEYFRSVVCYIILIICCNFFSVFNERLRYIVRIRIGYIVQIIDIF